MRVTRRLPGKLATVGLAIVLAASVVGSATAAVPTVTIEKKARIIDDGDAVVVSSTVVCPAGEEVLEAFLSVNQDGNSGNFAVLPVICDGVARDFFVVASATDFTYHKGKASVSAFVLLVSGDSTSPVFDVKLRAK